MKNKFNLVLIGGLTAVIIFLSVTSVFYKNLYQTSQKESYELKSHLNSEIQCYNEEIEYLNEKLDKKLDSIIIRDTIISYEKSLAIKTVEKLDSNETLPNCMAALDIYIGLSEKQDSQINGLKEVNVDLKRISTVKDSAISKYAAENKIVKTKLLYMSKKYLSTKWYHFRGKVKLRKQCIENIAEYGG